jgi:G:T-mismatch repair DNA endonuclease (very short patch repair protein)
MDHVDRTKRSLIMAAVHSKDTSPEVAVRKIVHGSRQSQEPRIMGVFQGFHVAC